MKLFSFFLRRSWSKVVLAIITAVIGGLSSTYLIALVNQALSVQQPAGGDLILKFVGLCALSLTSGIISQLLLIHLAQWAMLELRLHLCRQILAVPLRRLEDLGSHQIFASLMDDVFVISGAFTSSPSLFMNAAMLIGAVIYIGWLSWTALATVLGFIVFGFASRIGVLRTGRQAMRKARMLNDDLFKHFSALTEALKELKLNRSRRKAFLRSLQHTAETYRRYTVYSSTLQSAATRWTQLLLYILIGLLLFALPRVANVSVETLTGCILGVLFLNGPLAAVVNAVPFIMHANIAVQKVESLGVSLSANTTDDESAAAAETPSRWEKIELAEVTHTYTSERDDNNFTLGPVTLSFKPGEIIFLIGGNGSGKTTLAKLLTGLYIPQSGLIELDGQPVTDDNRDDYRQHFSSIFTDFYLFDSLLGIEAPGLDNLAQDYLVQLQLDHKVRVENGILSTVALSQGQRKRLALLTAYLEDRHFYIFDEWAADQDPSFKEVFYTQFLPNLKRQGKTIIAINHDEKYFYVADRIIKLDYGKVEKDLYQDNKILAQIL